jgi:hypothetical protein
MGDGRGAVSGAQVLKAAVLAAAGLAAVTIIRIAGAILDEELRSRLFRLPYLLLRLARRRLPADLRDLHDEDWLPDLEYIVRATDGLPVTRLVRGTGHAFGILVSVRQIVRANDPYGVYDITRDLTKASDHAWALAHGIRFFRSGRKALDPASARAFAAELDVTVGLAATLKGVTDVATCGAAAGELASAITAHLARARTSDLSGHFWIAGRPPAGGSSRIGSDLELLDHLARALRRADALAGEATAKSQAR